MRLSIKGTILVLLSLPLVCGCDKGGTGGESVADGKPAESVESAAPPEGAPEGAPPTDGVRDNDAGAMPGEAPMSSPASSVKPTPAPSGNYGANITKVDKSKDDPSRYNMEVIFTSGQGRDFVIDVISDKTKTVMFSEPVSFIPDNYYAHTTSFSYAGPLSDLNVQVKFAEDQRVLDTWDL